jgi:hypothetical protein
VVLSGMNDIDKMKEKIKETADVYLQKPLTTDALKDCLIQLIFQKNYGLPQVNNIYLDYDFDKPKSIQVLDIYISEWKQLRDILYSAITNQHTESFDKAFHKLITSLRKLEMMGMIQKMETWRNDHPQLNKAENLRFAQRITAMFNFSIHVFKEEKRKMLNGM